MSKTSGRGKLDRANEMFSGVFSALCTPFKGGAIDWTSMKRLVRYQIDGGVKGFVINGTTAESPTLEESERDEIFRFVRKEVGTEFPLIMGTGSNSTAKTIRDTKRAQELGAHGVLVVVPYYNKPPQRGLFQHFQKVAESTSLPVILYNVPSRTITKLEPQTIVDLSRIENIVGVKEASGDLALGKQLATECEPGFLVLSGDDGTFIDLCGVGGSGVISVASHVLPKEFSSWCERARQGDKEPRNEFTKYIDFNNYLYCEANPIPLKMALHLMGLIDSPELRLPLVALGEVHKAELKSKMEAVGLAIHHGAQGRSL